MYKIAHGIWNPNNDSGGKFLFIKMEERNSSLACGAKS